MSLREFLFVICIIVGLVSVLLPAVRQAKQAAKKSQCRNNLKQISLALRNYHDTFGEFPPACTLDVEGKPLHSWRTLLLPYLDQVRLYESIDLSKPWDDPVNSIAAATSVPAYECPDARLAKATTSYLAVVTSKSCLRPVASHSLAEIKDNLSQTLLVMEVDTANAIHWMSPTDASESLVVNLNSQSKLTHRSYVTAVFADGSVKGLNANSSPKERLALISIAENDPVSEVP